MINVSKENSRLKAGFKFICVCLFWPLKGLIKIFPRRRNVWLFGVAVGLRYADNTKALFEWVNLNRSEVTPVWITKRKSVKKEVLAEGFSCYLSYEPMGLYYCLIGGVYIFCFTSSDINFWTSFGATKINIWHGTPLKKIGRDIASSEDRDYKVFNAKGVAAFYYKCIYPGFFEHIDVFCSASTAVSSRFKTAWGLTDEQIKVTGYPRNDILFSQNLLRGFGADVEKINSYSQQNKRIITYLPTYRERVTQGSLVDWEALNERMKKLDSLFVVKLHPFDKTVYDFSSFDCLISLVASVDVYPLLSLTDVLVTDYSSVVYDYLILDRPIIYFAFDLDEYVRFDRGMYEPFLNDVAGPVVSTFNELLASLENVCFSNEFDPARRGMAQKFNQYQDASSSLRLFRVICDQVQLSAKALGC